MPALTTGGGKGGDHIGATAADLAPDLSPEQFARARQVAEFLRKHGAWTGGDLVTLEIDGRTYIVVDIRMRMLSPEEAAAAHELTLPKLITLPKRDRSGKAVIDHDGKPVMIVRPLTKTEMMRLVGNSVPKRMAKLLALANSRHLLNRYAPMAAE